METFPKERLALMVKRYKNIYEMKPDNYDNAMDIRGNPTTVCPCGSVIWNLKVKWDSDSGDIGFYFRDMECSLCGTRATAPIPLDAEEVGEI
jgi:hypothetical protein